MGGKGAFYKAKYGGGGKGGGKGSKSHSNDSGSWQESGSSFENNEQQEKWSGNARRSDEGALRSKLASIDGRPYGAYRDLEGCDYSFSDFTIHLDKAQSDPFAAPSKMRIFAPTGTCQFPKELLLSKVHRVALGDFICRRFWEDVHKLGLDEVKQSKSYHDKKGGELNIARPSQHVLERNSVIVTSTGDVEVRFQLSLPARGRTILGYECQELMCVKLPAVVRRTLPYSQHDSRCVISHVQSVCDQEELRSKLHELKLVSFIANGSILPRRSGDDDRPMQPENAIAFKSPKSLETTIKLKYHGEITGMGIPTGVTVIVGGGFHGKSTILNAIEHGVYNNIPGDGREFVSTISSAMKIRAEDRRSVSSVNISSFLNNLPFDKDTSKFSTQGASGSTSQAANIIESLEIGSKLLLIDEDTCATNFMIRDKRMQLLVSKDKEPITPFVLRVNQLHDELETSTICVVGGAGDYLEVANTVIHMDSYVPKDVTDEAKEVVKKTSSATMTESEKLRECGSEFGAITHRIPKPDGITSCLGFKSKVFAKNRVDLVFGNETIDMSCVEQLVENEQLTAIGDYLPYLASVLSKKPNLTLQQVISEIEASIDANPNCGLDVIRPSWQPPSGIYSRPRKLEIAAAINRLRTMTFKTK
eukprot:TRINITY_DN1287_c0_g1_i1.p1 TRINITY_DN1287_c0_g1~~TRINITY_DN1287_c0_g1_i1.p1  ORF type:complete len:646 (+),score=109.40 TRINITY_DN1287_c0_g1_i1:43-1980(+)